MSERTVSSVPAGPQNEYAALMRPTYVPPVRAAAVDDQVAREREQRDRVRVGSARMSMTVSEREGALPSSGRWSYPIRSAFAGSPGIAWFRLLAALAVCTLRGAKACAFSSV